MANVAEQGTVRDPLLEAEGLDRGVGFFGLLWSCEGSIIGSGWLFGAVETVQIAGPAALIGWGIASLIIIVLALVHAELGGLFPVSGGTSRFPHYAFGSLAGGTFGWFAYLQAATVAPIEVLAVIQYASTYSWARGWYSSQGTLRHAAIPIAIGLVFVAVIINILGIRWFARINNAFTTWKILIPVLAIIVLLATHLHTGNFHAAGGFFVHSGGGALKNILVAIPAGGIIFSLLGFEQAVQLGSEAKNPKNIPRAVITSILIGATLYILVQIAFIGSVEPSLLAKAGTWTNILPTNHNKEVAELYQAPFYRVASFAGIAWLAVVLRLDAAISPGGTALIYTTSTSRLSFGLSKNGYLPAVFEWISKRNRVPVWGIIISGIVGVLFLLPFPSWTKLVGVVTDASVLMYAGAPLAMGALRLQKPKLARIYTLPAGTIVAPIAFILANLVIYFTGYTIFTTLLIALLIGYAIMLITAALHLNDERPRIEWRSGWWVFPYLIGMGVIMYFGNFGPGALLDSRSSGNPTGLGIFANVLVGGRADIKFGWDFLIVAGWSLVIYLLAMRFRLSEAEVDHNVREVYPPELAGE